jgi:hypothetical protein
MERFRASAPFRLPYPGQLSIWMVLGGEAHLATDGYERTFQTGETVLVPALCGRGEWTANEATLLGVTLP